MDFTTGVQIVLVICAMACWRRTKNTNLAPFERLAILAYSAYYILLALTIFLSRISLVLAAKTSSITAAILLALGLFGNQVSKDPDPYIPNVDPERVGVSSVFGRDFEWWERSERWKLRKVLAVDIILLAIALGLTSAIVWAILFLKSHPS